MEHGGTVPHSSWSSCSNEKDTKAKCGCVGPEGFQTDGRGTVVTELIGEECGTWSADWAKLANVQRGSGYGENVSGRVGDAESV